MSSHCSKYPNCGCPEHFGTKCHLPLEENVECEGCEKKIPISEARMDDEDANWWCHDCVSISQPPSSKDVKTGEYTMKNVPTKIFLVVDCEEHDERDFKALDHEFVCWCQDRINKSDIEYTLNTSQFNPPSGGGSKEDWISVDERLPEDYKNGLSKSVLVFGRGALKVDYYNHTIKDWEITIYDKITHWIPLPSPPTSNKGSRE